MNSNAGLIIVSQIYTPALQPPDRNPTLRQASDLLFLNWYHNALTGSDPNGLHRVRPPEHALILQVVNEQTVATVKYIYQKNNIVCRISNSG